MKVNYAGPYYNEKELVAAKEALDDGWLVMGKKCYKFERQFCKYFGKDHGIFTNSGSSANLLMISALKSNKLKLLKDGDGVITPVSGFPTTVNPIIQNNLRPIFCDIELETLNINVDSIPDIDAKAMIFAHVLGNPANMKDVIDFCGPNDYHDDDIILLEDCCDAVGSTYKEKKLGSFGLMSSCSMYPAHHITTLGEGGFVSTNDAKVHQTLLSLRGWGGGCHCSGKARDTVNGACGKRFSNWINAFSDESFDHRYVYSEIGYNLKPIEIQGAVGLEQLKKFDEIKRIRQKNWARLNSIFSQYEEFFIVHQPRKGCDVNWFAFPCTVRSRNVFKRFDFCHGLEKRGIQTRPYFAGNLLLQPAYKNITNLTTQERKDKFPVATRVMLDTFFLGVSPVITDKQLDYIEESVSIIMKDLT